MGIFDGLIGSVVSGIGGVFANDATADRQREASAFNAAEAEKNRQFQDQMSSTAFQRGMSDMKAAGLNPILAYQKGPASSPSGATASTTFAPATNVGEAMVNSYNNSARTASDNAKTDAGTDLVKQELQNAKATFDQIRANTAQSLSQTTKNEQDARLSEAQTKSVQVQTEGHSAENVSKKLDAERLDTFAGRWSALLGRGFKEVNPLAGGAVGIMKGVR